LGKQASLHAATTSAAAAQTCTRTKMLTCAPLMVIYRKQFSTLCYISRPNGLPTKYPEVAHTFLAETDP